MVEKEFIGQGAHGGVVAITSTLVGKAVLKDGLQGHLAEEGNIQAQVDSHCGIGTLIAQVIPHGTQPNPKQRGWLALEAYGHPVSKSLEQSCGV